MWDRKTTKLSRYLEYLRVCEEERVKRAIKRAVSLTYHHQRVSGSKGVPSKEKPVEMKFRNLSYDNVLEEGGIIPIKTEEPSNLYTKKEAEQIEDVFVKTPAVSTQAPVRDYTAVQKPRRRRKPRVIRRASAS